MVNGDGSDTGKIRGVKKTVFILAAIFGALVFLEAFAQLIKIVSPEWFSLYSRGDAHYSMLPDENLVWTLSPGDHYGYDTKIHVNKFRMRGSEPMDPKPAEVYRILFLGDSSVFGHGVMETLAFPWITAQDLEVKYNIKTEIVNAAVPGYSSTQCKIVLEKNVGALKPDAVVMAAMWSDMMRLPQDDDTLILKTQRQWMPFGRLARKSALIRFLSVRIARLTGLESRRTVILESIFRYDPKKLDSSFVRVSSKRHLANLLAVGKLCRERKIDLFLVCLPTNRAKLVKEGAREEIESYRENYATAAKALSAPLLEMDAIVYDNKGEPYPYLFLDSVHPNVPGHRLIGNHLAALISEYKKKL